MDERRPSEGDDSLAPAAVLRAFHRAQRGAVIVAAFAAVLVLFMLGLTLYDASHVAGEKIDVQNAADAAAYSQAAVEARSMNMISFANAGKRTMSGLHNMYWAMWWAYLTWWSGECSSCCCCSITCCNCWSCSCRNCWFNAPLIIIEGLADWWSFSGLPIVPAVLPGAGHSGSAFAREMAELDSYQTYIADITPWWSWSEQLLRGSRNRATVTSSFPPPPDPLSVGINLLNRLTGLFGISLWPQFNFNDSLPVAKFPDGNQFTDAAAACSPAAGIGTITPGSGAETMGNRDHHENRSSGPPLLACDGPSDLVNRGMGLIPATCMFTVGYYGYPQIGGPGSNPMAPFHLSAAEHWASPTRPGSQLPGSASALLKRSNTIFAYRHSPETQGKLRANYDAVIQEGYNSRGGLFGTLVNPVRGASGLWAISRSELTYPKPVPGLARHGTWMWHSGWTAKLRPVALPGEFAAVSRAFPAAGRTSVLNAMYHDVLPYLAAGATLMGLTGSGNFSFTAFAKDFYYMEKATVSMDNESSNALPK